MAVNYPKKFVFQIGVVFCALLLLNFKAYLQGLITVFGWGKLPHLIGVLIEIFVWTSFGWLASGIIQSLLWSNLEKRLGHPVPKLLQDIVTATIGFTVILSVCGFVLHAPLSGLIAGSSVLAAVIGLAITRMISDVFSGVALSVERAYNIGDWMEVEMRSRPGGSMIGRVVEINWRATRLHTKADEIIVIPNSEMARTKFINYSIPERHYRAEVQVTLSDTIATERAKRILMAALLSTPGIMQEPEPQVILRKFDPRGVLWCLWFWVSDYAENVQVTKVVHENVLKHLHVAGIDLSYNRIDQRLVPENNGRREEELVKLELIRGIEFFKIMGENYLTRIAEGMERKKYSAQEFIVTQDEAGSSLFIVEEGLVNILVKDAAGTNIWVAHIQPGGFFGEMALLTGEPRAASAQAETELICYEISKEILIPIFQESPELLEKISAVMAARKIRLRKIEAATSAQTGDGEEETTTHWLLQNMRNFFGIKLW
ncbi:MAG: mechanosensitive ion channel family protein [Desulfobaccales bacterium]